MKNGRTCVTDEISDIARRWHRATRARTRSDDNTKQTDIALRGERKKKIDTERGGSTFSRPLIAILTIHESIRADRRRFAKIYFYLLPRISYIMKYNKDFSCTTNKTATHVSRYISIPNFNKINESQIAWRHLMVSCQDLRNVRFLVQEKFES